jgi:folate-binding Fe-S cluster repair protein YgfZ
VIVSGVDGVAGTEIVASGRAAGTLGQVVGGRAVAVLRLDRITDVGDVTVSGRPATVELPTWATYQFGESSAED